MSLKIRNKQFIIFFIIIFNCVALFSEEDKVILSGTWSIPMDYNNQTIEIKGGKIENNNSYKSGNIILRVVATNAPFTGGTLKGYKLCETVFSPLEANHYYYNIDKTLTMDMPPDGNYNICVCIIHAGYITSYFNCSDLINIYTPKKTPTYSYDYPSYNSSSSSSESINWPTVVEEICPTCKGMGKNPYDYVTAPRYNGIDTTVYCDICKRNVYRHTHRTCNICHGTGKVKRTKWN